MFEIVHSEEPSQCAGNLRSVSARPETPAPCWLMLPFGPLRASLGRIARGKSGPPVGAFPRALLEVFVVLIVVVVAGLGVGAPLEGADLLDERDDLLAGELELVVGAHLFL